MRARQLQSSLLDCVKLVCIAGKGRRLGKKKLQEERTIPLQDLRRVQLYIDL